MDYPGGAPTAILSTKGSWSLPAGSRSCALIGQTHRLSRA